ncbi:MAG: DNA mismatch repair protein [Ruminococcus sp.]|nr:DNA mismatch repair protein [Ruminococcus sp.]
MNSENFSLFYPENADTASLTLQKEAINDLSVDYLVESLTKDPFEQNSIKQLLTQITCDEDVIRYRCNVFEDFLRFPKLREDLTALLAKLKDLREIERFQKDFESSSLWQLVNRLREMDSYVDCITQIKTTLEGIDIHSEGLITLRNKVQAIYNDSGFPLLKDDIETTLREVRKVKSITLGVNLDDMLRPKSVGVVCLNDTPFTDSGLLKKFLNFANKQSELHEGTDVSGFTAFHPANPPTSSFGLGQPVMGAQKDLNHIENSGLTGADPMSDALKRVVTDILKRTVNNLKSMLNKYVGISGYSFISLMPEIIFYIRFAELCDKIIALGLPLCKAEVTDKSSRTCDIKDIYNFKLAIKALENKASGEIVTNDFEFGDTGRIYILTGPNRGGKTTITQAVGLCFLLAQHGIYVPASAMSFSPCDNIYTHFPADENDTVDLGRLGEESKRLSDIFNTATKHSLLLLNESLATTNVSEGLYIAKDVIRAMRYLGVRCVFNTHMHDLARGLKEMNESTEGDSFVESMVTGVENGARSFKIFIAPPQGVSYAKDIAEKYGVTYDSIKKSIDNRKV